MKRTKRKKSQHKAGGRLRRPKTVEEFFATSPVFQDRWNRAAHVVSKMRSNRSMSLRRAAAEYQLDPRSVLRLRGSALRKVKNRRYVATKSDRLLTVLVVPSSTGVHEVGIRNSRIASRVAEYWDAVQRYLQIGDEAALNKFQGEQITDASGEKVLLITDTRELDRLGSAGVLSFESLYARSA